MVVGTGGEVLVAHAAAEKLLGRRQKAPLHAGLVGFGSPPSATAPDAQANVADAPRLFVAASGYRLVGGAGHKVALVGVEHLEVCCTGSLVSVCRRPRELALLSSLRPAALRLFEGVSEVAEATAAQLVADLHAALQTTLRPTVVWSAGATPRAVYRLLAERYRDALAWRRVRLYQMDAFVGLDGADVRAFYHQLREQLALPLGLSDTYLTGAETDTQMLACAEALQPSGIELILHGVGHNGHLGFNEPGHSFTAPSARVVLAKGTRADLARAHPHAGTVPTHNVTLGLAVLNAARRVRVMVNGTHKRGAGAAGLCAPAGGSLTLIEPAEVP